MTVKDIAELAGTSRGTVDRVLNGRGNVSPAVKARVLEIAKRAEYQPNHLARALINSRKRIRIGVVINSIGNPFFIDVLRGIYDRASKLSSYGVELNVKKIKGYDAKEQIDAVEELLAEGIDGLGIMPINVPEVSEYLSKLCIPIVTFNTDIDIPKLAFVGCDYYNSGRISGDLAKLMLGAGGKVAIVIGSTKITGHSERVRGFISSLYELPCVEVVEIIENEDDDTLSNKLVGKLLGDCQPDLIYFAAAGVQGGISAVLKSKSNIRILTVDGTDVVKDYLNSGIISATVTQQPFLQGENAIRILYEYLANNKKPREINNYTNNQVLLKNSK